MINLGEFIKVKGGKFIMGSPENEPGRFSDEIQHEVIIRSFEMGETPVTQKQWTAVMGNNPAYFQNSGANTPVESVSWNDVQIFIAKLNESQNKYIYRLPSEAEWEYACRAGTTTAYSFGDDITRLKRHTWCHENSDNETHPVQQKTPNNWGFYDMHGNVWELCQDFYENGSNRVIRGGSFASSAKFVRSGQRYGVTRGYRNRYVGFRLARTLRGKTSSSSSGNRKALKEITKKLVEVQKLIEKLK